MKNAARMVLKNFPTFRASLKNLKSDVLVGVPSDKAQRKAEETNEPMNNATIAYIQDNGSAAANIPARPFMQPGIEAVKSKIAVSLQHGARGALNGEQEAVEKGLNIAGLAAQASIRGKINEGIPPPLSPRTIAARKSRGRTGVKPLVDTGQLRNAINYVVRKK